MSREERFARSLESGDTTGLSGAERETSDQVREHLGDPHTWEQLPAGFEARLLDNLGRPGRGRFAWWAAAAAVVAVIGIVAVLNPFDDEVEPATVFAVVGTDLAPSANGTAALIETPNGWAIRFEVTGLPPAPAGQFYQAWVNNGVDAVSAGTFHMRGDRPTPVSLWSGVDLHEYRMLNITLQTVGEGPASSGLAVMTGAAEPFE